MGIVSILTLTDSNQSSGSTTRSMNIAGAKARR